MTTEKTMDKIKEKIRKCLALAEGAKTEGEAHAAAMMAQKLLAKHHLAEKDVRNNIEDNESVVHKKVDFPSGWGPGRWKARLHIVIAENFRCESYTYSFGSSTRKQAVFLGLEEDTDMAVATFETMIKAGQSIFKRWSKKQRALIKEAEQHKAFMLARVREHAAALEVKTHKRQPLPWFINNQCCPMKEIISLEHDLVEKRKNLGDMACVFAVPPAWLESPLDPSTTAVKNGWYCGFVDGVKEALHKQRESNEELAICLQVPSIVKAEYGKMVFTGKSRRSRCSMSGKARANGQKAGLACGSRKSLSA